MSEECEANRQFGMQPGRRAILGAALALGSLAAGTVKASADSKVSGDSDPDSARTSLHQEVTFNATPARIYEILLDSKMFGDMTGLHADISPDPGGPFAMFGGIIVGRNIELVPDARIVQAWKPNYWPPGVYSLVKFELLSNGASTKLILDHTGFPEGKYTSLYSGWSERYWDPLRKYPARQK